MVPRKAGNPWQCLSAQILPLAVLLMRSQPDRHASTQKGLVSSMKVAVLFTSLSCRRIHQLFPCTHAASTLLQHMLLFLGQIYTVLKYGAGTPANGALANGTVANGNGKLTSTPLLDPVKGNVAFASCAYGYCFTLKSFAQLYKGVCGDDPKDVLLIDEFAKRLWGDVWYYPEERVFRRKPSQLGTGHTAQAAAAEQLIHTHGPRDRRKR